MTTEPNQIESLTKVGGIIASMGVAAIVAWRGRAGWKLPQEDLPGAAEKIAGLVVGVVSAIIWVKYADEQQRAALVWIAVSCLGVCLWALTRYIHLNTTMVYQDERKAEGDGNVIGGDTLMPEAEQAIRRNQREQGEAFGIQGYLDSVGGEPDAIWTRDSRARVKKQFVVTYIALLVSGSLALTSTATLLALHRGEEPTISQSPLPSNVPPAKPALVSNARLSASPQGGKTPISQPPPPANVPPSQLHVIRAQLKPNFTGHGIAHFLRFEVDGKSLGAYRAASGITLGSSAGEHREDKALDVKLELQSLAGDRKKVRFSIRFDDGAGGWPIIKQDDKSVETPPAMPRGTRTEFNVNLDASHDFNQQVKEFNGQLTCVWIY